MISYNLWDEAGCNYDSSQSSEIEKNLTSNIAFCSSPHSKRSIAMFLRVRHAVLDLSTRDEKPMNQRPVKPCCPMPKLPLLEHLRKLILLTLMTDFLCADPRRTLTFHEVALVLTPPSRCTKS